MGRGPRGRRRQRRRALPHEGLADVAEEPRRRHLGLSSATGASRRQARGHPGLRALEVGDGALGCEGAAALARGLAGGGLRRWALEGKGVKGPGVEAIAAAISQHDWGLEELLLSDNPVGDEVGPILHSVTGSKIPGFFGGELPSVHSMGRLPLQRPPSLS